MLRPTDQQIAIAAMWLRCNEGADGESEACSYVADWIEYEAQQAMLRSEARKAGIPVAMVRLKLKGGPV